MLYIEPIPPKRVYFLLVAAFLLLYLPFLNVRELQTAEAFHLTVAREMMAGGDLLHSTVHGEEVSDLPLYPWLVCVTRAAGFTNEWAARLPGVLAVLAMAALCSRLAARAGGHLAGVVAGAVVLSCLITLREGRIAQVNVVAAVLISAAWFAWYRLGRVYRRWGLAWCAGLSFTLVAFLGIGIMAFVYFYFPFLFLRRPLRIWRRFWVPAHMLVLAAIVVAVWTWLRLSPPQTILPWNTLRASLIPENTETYMGHLFTFPFICAWDLLPWSCAAWPAFCVAFRAVERTPIFCRYLRTLVLTVFGAAWLLPGATTVSLLPVVGPLAVLTGLYFDVLLRRYHSSLAVLPRALGGLALAGGTLGLLLAGLHLAGAVVFANLSYALLGGSVSLLGLGLLLAVWLRRGAEARAFWLRLLGAAVALQCVFLALYPPYKALFYDRRRIMGQTLSQSLPRAATVYRLREGPLVAEFVTMPQRVLRVASPVELPAAEPVLYVLGGAKAPILETRTWEACSPPAFLHQRSQAAVHWRPPGGGLILVERQWSPSEAESSNSVARMYRGTLRPAVEQIKGVLPETPPSSATPDRETQ